MATLKNLTINDTGYLQMPSGTVAQRPASPSQGMIRYNTDYKVSEYYNGTEWVSASPVPMVTNGLTLYLDATSYPGSGTTWTDLSGNGYNMTLTGSFTFTGAALQFNGGGGSLTSLNYSTTNFTIMAGSRYSGATRGRVISSMGNNWLFGHWSNSTQKYYAEGWITNSSQNENSDTNWRIYTGLENYTSDQRSFYVNNTALVTNSTAGAAGFNGLSVGRWGVDNSEGSNCEVSFILVYNRLLSSEEMTQNFNAFRGRFGI
jgi:hypothetical protein